MERRYLSRLRQEIVHEVLDSGLRVVVMPKPGFRTRYAGICVRYGGMDNSFVSLEQDSVLHGQDEPEVVTLPAGVAHFLEHQLFEQPDGVNASDVLTAMGAMDNAFTDRHRTNYHFTIRDAEGFPRALRFLMEYVQTPAFTDVTVAKEKGIIKQEIAMGNDDAEWWAWEELTTSLYHTHPVRSDIVGTTSSVEATTVDDLFRSYGNFYRPENMAVVVVGDEDPAAIIGMVESSMVVGRMGVSNNGSKPSQTDTSRLQYAEPPSVARPIVRRKMSIGRPVVAIGYKGLPSVNLVLSPQTMLRRRLLAQVICEAVFGQTSSFFWHQYALGNVTKGMTMTLEDYGSVYHLVLQTETEDEDVLVDEINKELLKVMVESIPDDIFDLAKKVVMGSYIAKFDSPSRLGTLWVYEGMDGIDILDIPGTIDSLQPKEAGSFLSSLVRPDSRAVVVAIPSTITDGNSLEGGGDLDV